MKTTHHSRAVQVFLPAVLLAILIFLAVPVFAALRDDAQSALCKDNLRLWHTAWVTHALDNDGRVPRAQSMDHRGIMISWISRLTPYLGFDSGTGASVYWLNGHEDTPGSCPADKHEHGYQRGEFGPENYISYAYNAQAMGIDWTTYSAIYLTDLQSRVIVFGDNFGNWHFSGRDGIGFRHDGVGNLVLADGSIYQAREDNSDDPPLSMWTRE